MTSAAERLKEIVISYSVPEISRRTGIPRRSVQSIVDGNLPSIEKAEKICKSVDMPLTILSSDPPDSADPIQIKSPKESGIGAAAERDAALTAIKSALGLPAEASADDILAAIERLRAENPLPPAATTALGRIESAVVDAVRQVVDEVGDEVRAPAPPPYDATRHIEVVELAAAAGAGAVDLDERITGHLVFRRAWLARRGLEAAQCVVLRVRGESMEPTLPDGCSILIDRARRVRRPGHIYVLRTGDGLVVKRLARGAGGGWQLTSDHPSWAPVPWTDTCELIGEVCWMARNV